MVIISYKHKFIYIKTKKTASSSIQVLLENYCGINDVVTPLGKPTTEQGIIYNKKARNYNGFQTHMSAKDVKKKIGRKSWNQFYKFSFERNPWDKIVSYYHFRRGKLDFNKLVKTKDKRREVYNYKLYTIRGNVALDFIGKYENLEVDLKTIFEKLNLPLIKLTNEKGNYRKDNIHYRNYYNNTTKKIIEKDFKKEIKLFGYTF